MIHSLNTLSESLAERVGRQYDIPFKEQIKLWIAAWRSTLMRQALEKRPKDRKFFVTSLEIPLIEVSPSGLHDIDCKVLRTECPLPSPLRANNTLFDFIGSADMLHSISLVPTHSIMYLNEGKYTGKKTRAGWVDNHIFVYNAPLMKSIRVHGIFDNLSELKETCAYYPGKPDSGSCIDDDAPYPVSMDIQQQIIRSILGTELSAQIPEETSEIKLDNDN